MIRGPLHGLPFSVKDNVSIKGYDSTVGLTKFIDDPSAEDAALVAALKSLGAIPFCKTNVPQTLLRSILSSSLSYFKRKLKMLLLPTVSDAATRFSALPAIPGARIGRLGARREVKRV